MDHAEDTTLQSTSILLVMIPKYYIIPQQALKRGKGTKNNLMSVKKKDVRNFTFYFLLKVLAICCLCISVICIKVSYGISSRRAGERICSFITSQYVTIATSDTTDKPLRKYTIKMHLLQQSGPLVPFLMNRNLILVP